jgi:hypothetical protein
MSRTTEVAVDESSGGRSQIQERVTVNLTAKAAEALAEAVRLTRDSKTDTVNKALIIYAMLQQLQASEGAVYVREKDGELERLRLL